MERISSRSTFFIKRVFPLIWFGSLALIVIAPLLARKPKGGPPVVFFIMPILMAVFGYFLMKKLVFDLADEVFDAGDALVVRFGSEQERIALSEIINVSYSYHDEPAPGHFNLANPWAFWKGSHVLAATEFRSFCQKPNRRQPDRARRCSATGFPFVLGTVWLRSNQSKRATR